MAPLTPARYSNVNVVLRRARLRFSPLLFCVCVCVVFLRA